MSAVVTAACESRRRPARTKSFMHHAFVCTLWTFSCMILLLQESSFILPLVSGINMLPCFVNPFKTDSHKEGTVITSICPFTGSVSNDDNHNQQEASSPTPDATALPPPSFLAAIFGIAINQSPWEYMISLRREGYDGVVPINLGPLGVYNFLLSPESVRSATVEEATILPRRFSVPLFETLELDRGIVYEQGKRHKRQKRLCIPSFEQTRSMEIFVKATRDELDALIVRFDKKAVSEQKKIDLYAEMRRATLDIVLAVTFGLGARGANDFDRGDELSKTIGEYLERIVALANEIPPLWQISPRLSSNYVKVTDELLPNLRELVSEVIDARRDSESKIIHNEDRESIATKLTQSAVPDRSNSRADLLSILIEAPNLTDADIRSILFDIVIAGSDTTASTATAALYVLHEPMNADWLAKTRREAIEMNAGDEIALENIRSQLPVATSVAREILRLFPPVPFVGRTATEDGSICDESYEVKVGDTFCFSPWFLGRDPKAWKDAERFNPQRWLDDGASGGAASTYSWLPFGAGPRGCLGTRLGLTEVTLGISRLLRDYEFEFERDGPLPVKYDLTLNLDGVMGCKLRKIKQPRQ